MKWSKIKFVITPFKNRKIVEPIEVVNRSRYAQLLFDEGAGWNE